MDKMIIYKEWIKTRGFLLGALVVLTVLTAYTILNLSKIVELQGADVLWSTLIMKDTVLIESLRYLPVAVGCLLAVFQFFPEITRKRLKLTLHLPYPQGKMIFMMYAYGIIAFLAICSLQAAILTLFLRKWLVAELAGRVMRTAMVWYLAGLAAYLFTASALLEPTWKRGVFILAVTLGVMYLLFLSPVPEAYNGFLPWLVIYVLGIQLLIYCGVSRFKEGLQD
ncbi:MAG: hypothetical protein IJM41_04935 [Bacteroidales bacterium]|nr:hypothetical protein [Bacteroidales bacterium]